MQTLWNVTFTKSLEIDIVISILHKRLREVEIYSQPLDCVFYTHTHTHTHTRTHTQNFDSLSIWNLFLLSVTDGFCTWSITVWYNFDTCLFYYYMPILLLYYITNNVQYTFKFLAFLRGCFLWIKSTVVLRRRKTISKW